MKKNDISNYLSALLAGLVLTFSSCQKYLGIDPPNDKLATPNAFADSASAALAITGIYSSMMGTNSGFVAYQVRLAGLCADELLINTTAATYVQLMDNNLQADNSLLSSEWNSLYTYIYQANSVIEGVEAAPAISPSAKRTLTAEAKFIRAFLFFYTAGNWGDVPLTLSTDYQVNASMPRTPLNEVYAQVIRDLQDAAGALPAAYLTAERVRPNKMAAMALLARVYLYTENWQQAESYATQVIGSGQYLPMPAPASVFLKDSRETIWQLYPATLGGQYDTYDGSIFVPASLTNTVIPSFLIPQSLYTSFDNRDARRTAWIGSKPSSGNYYFPYKYKVRSKTAAQASQEYTVVLRLAEQYLIRAEARARLNNESGALSDLNAIRGRAGLDNLPSDLDADVLLQAAELERSHELFCEWGHRWFDLKRTNRAGEVLTALKGSAKWQPEDALWPLPADQLLANPSLVQNKGY